MSKVVELIGIAKGYRRAMKVLAEFHELNLCNIGNGTSGCYCLELKQTILESMGEALNV